LANILLATTIPTELCDPDGRVLGLFVPEAFESADSPAIVEIDDEKGD
jgi:hypothetical protein